MGRNAGISLLAARWAILASVLALGGALAGCSSEHAGSARADGAAPSCAATVLDTLSRVIRRVYHEGVSSERTRVAQRAIAASAPLRQAVEADDPAATRAAAEALVAGGKLTNLLVIRGGRTLADVGGPAVAPLRGALTGAGGAPIATYVTSVWSDEGLLAESQGIAEGRVALRRDGRSVGGSLALPAGALPAAGALSFAAGGRPRGHYQFASFGGKAFPSGALRVYLVRSLASTAPLCGATSEDTTVNTLSRVARRVYEGEGGRRTVPQVRRVQHDRPLLEAVARNDPLATRVAVERLLHRHVVRLRVYGGGRLLADVGGPYVLAPVTAPLRLRGRRIGRIVLSIQDDEGYLRLARRLVGLRVLMYMAPANPGSAQPQLVKNSLGPDPGAVPDSGRYSYRGGDFRVYTLHARAFPAQPLTIHVLIPIPYS